MARKKTRRNRKRAKKKNGVSPNEAPVIEENNGAAVACADEPAVAVSNEEVISNFEDRADLASCDDESRRDDHKLELNVDPDEAVDEPEAKSSVQERADKVLEEIKQLFEEDGESESELEVFGSEDVESLALQEQSDPDAIEPEMDMIEYVEQNAEDSSVDIGVTDAVADEDGEKIQTYQLGFEDSGIEEVVDAADLPALPNASVNPELVNLLSDFESRTESMMARFEERFAAMLQQATLPTGHESEQCGKEMEETQKSSGLDWDAQKKAMLAEYGAANNSDAEVQEQESGSKTSQEANAVESPVSEKSPASEAEVDSKDREDSQEPLRVDDKAIAELKEQLTSKLREAEIELSINRAKVAQQKAAIEELQADLERREEALEKKLADTEYHKGKTGVISRWKRQFFGGGGR